MMGKPFDTLIEEGSYSRYNRLAKALRDGRWWMLKGLKPEHEDDPVMRALLRKEFNLGMMLRHPGIVGFVSLELVPQLGGGEFIVQEWVEGVTLKRWLECDHKWPEKVNVLQQMCEVLDYCHRMNVVHRDIKPSNIMITPDERVVLIDLGLAVAGNQSAFRTPAGTERYMAPEQRREDVIVDGRADLYAVGFIMQEMELPQRFKRVISLLQQPDRNKRPSDARLLHEALAHAASSHRRWFKWAVMFLLTTVCLATAYALGTKDIGTHFWGTGKLLAPTLPDYLTDTVNYWSTDTAHYITVIKDSIPYTFPKMSYDIPGDIDEDAAVDLGLNVLWAPFNVGCDRPSLFMTGGYYGYGDPTGKLTSIDDKSCSMYWNVSSQEDYSGTEYDIAHVQWGGRWRTPRQEDMDELINRCQWTYIQPEGVAPGYLIIGPNGNRIYLPMAGFRYEFDYYELGKMGYYWITSPREEKVTDLSGFVGLALTLVPGGLQYGYAIVNNGFSVRPVLDR